MRQSISVLALIVGLALLVSAFLTAPPGRSATEERVLRLNVNSTDITYLDPALNYDFYGWRLEAATCAMLLGYPDRAGRANARLYPEVAKGFPKISNGGKTYTFTLRSGYRFSDGSAVTAESYARAIERALDPKMQSPAATFLSDVVGAARVQSGKATRPAGVTTSGNTLTVRLTKVAPDFLSRIAMPFFCAVPLEPARRSPGRQYAPGRRPLLRLQQEEGHADRAPQEPVLPRPAPAELGRDSRRPSRWASRRAISRSARARPTSTCTRCRPRRTRS